jgi:hypothetical protein
MLTKEDPMVVGKITLDTCYGVVEIPVEILGVGPRPGTAWVQALGGLHPFTRISHGGPFQSDSAVVLLPNLRDVQVTEGPEEGAIEYEPDTEVPIPVPEWVPAPDWFLESAYEERVSGE